MPYDKSVQKRLENGKIRHAKCPPKLWRKQMKDPNAEKFRSGHVKYLSMGIWLTPSIAFAYIGPGLSLGTLVFGGILLLSVLFALYAVIWFPIQRRLRERKGNAPEVVESPADEAHEE